MHTPPAESGDMRLVLTSRTFICPDAAREVIAVPNAHGSESVPAPKLEKPLETPDIEDPGVPLESKPDFQITSRLDVGWRLIGILILTGAPALFMLGEATPGLTEKTTLDASTAAYDRQIQFKANPYAPERLAPVEAGAVKAENPPGTTWVHLTATLGLRHAEASIADLHYRARLTSVFAGIFTVLMVFWCGYSIGGLSTATFAGLIAASLPGLAALTRQARPEPLQMAAATFTMAMALWAIRPLRDPAHIARQMLGWTLAGAGLGAAILCGGPAAAPPLLLSMFVVVMVCPHRLGHTLGLLAALCIGVLLLIPWVLLAIKLNPDAIGIWAQHIMPVEPAHGWPTFWPKAGRLALLLLLALGPWLLWVLGAMLQPFSTSSTGVRQRMLIGWSWFVSALFMLLLAPLANHDVGIGALMLALPPASILIGQLMRRFADLAMANHLAKFWRSTRWVMAGATLAIPVMVPLLVLWVQGHPAPDWLPTSITLLSQTSLTHLLIGCIPMLFIALLGMLCAAASLPLPATVCWTLWTTVGLLTLMPLR